MKKVLFIIFGFVAGAVFAQQLPLSEVINRSARGVEESLSHGTMIAITNFASSSEEFSEYVIEELTGEFLENGKIIIVDRRNLAHIREEMKLQLSGEVSDETALSLGRLLGAHYIITGTLTNMKTYHRFRIRIINVENGAIQRQITHELKNDTQVTALLNVEQEKTANVQDNWISGEINFTGIGIRYERMLGSHLSLGLNGYISSYFISGPWMVGLEVPIRFYPTGGIIYIEAALGYGSQIDDQHSNGFFTIAPGIGWKIDVGKPGGLFLQIGLGVTLILGEYAKANADSWHSNGTSALMLRGIFFGMGSAF